MSIAKLKCSWYQVPKRVGFIAPIAQGPETTGRRNASPKGGFVVYFPLFGYARTLGGNCSTCYTDLDPDWTCPGAVAAYNDLLGNPGGTAANIIETHGSTGRSCPVHRCLCRLLCSVDTRGCRCPRIGHS